MGFWVASTKNGRGRVILRPAAVTVRSCIASKRADWVFGVARLISSASSSWVKIGPAWYCARVRPCSSGTSAKPPVMSAGIRSGVNWMRAKLKPVTAPSVRTRSVLPIPGVPSSKTCPSQIKAISNWSMTSRWPTTAFAISARARERASSSCSSAAASMASAEDIAAVASALSVLVTDIPPPSSRVSPPRADEPGSIAYNQVSQEQGERCQDPNLPCGARDPSRLDTRKDLLLGRKHPAASRGRERGEARGVGAREFMQRRIGHEQRRLGGGLLGDDTQIEFAGLIQRE